MIDERNVHIFSRFDKLIAKVGDLADELRLLRVELMSLECDVTHELSRDEDEEDDVTDGL